MGKDREGKFHPRKGKPSGAIKTEDSGLKSVSTSAFEQNLEIAEKYTIGEEEPAPHLRIRHRNRNADKREDKQQDRASIRNTKAKRQTATEIGVDTIPGQMLSEMNKESFADLANFQSSHCISIYLPTHAS